MKRLATDLLGPVIELIDHHVPKVRQLPDDLHPERALPVVLPDSPTLCLDEVPEEPEELPLFPHPVLLPRDKPYRVDVPEKPFQGKGKPLRPITPQQGDCWIAMS